MQQAHIHQPEGYIETTGNSPFISEGQMILDLMGAGYEDDISKMLIHERHLSETFFDLKSRIAGEILQKLMQYHFKAVFIVSESRLTGRFGQMAQEENLKQHFRFTSDLAEGREWLIRNR